MKIYATTSDYVTLFGRVKLNSNTTGLKAFAGTPRPDYYYSAFFDVAKHPLKPMAAHHIIPIEFARGTLADGNTTRNPTFKMMEKLTKKATSVWWTGVAT
jgi:hypothetical protein